MYDLSMKDIQNLAKKSQIQYLAKKYSTEKIA